MKTTITNGIEFGFRFYTCVLFCIYGVGKVVQFGGAGHYPADKINPDMSGQDIMWLFFGYSLTYPLIIGAFQVVGGILLLFERTKLLGILILLPVVSNIIIMDIIYSVNFGALLYAISLLGALFFVMYWERKKVVEVMLVIIKKTKNFTSKEKWIHIAIGMLFSLLLFILVRILGDMLLP